MNRTSIATRALTRMGAPAVIVALVVSITASPAAAGTAPTITSFNPSHGTVGTTVAIHGTDFTGVSSVTFNGAPAAFTFVSDVKVTAVVPNGATTGRIMLTTPSGTATSGSDFSVTGTAGPTISSFNPSQGNVGTLVTLNGANFTGVSSVRFNGTSAAFTFVDSSKITAVVPNGATTGRIMLTTPSGTATSGSDFSVTGTAGPTISSFNPPQGNVGTVVTIHGTNFTGVSSVRFNGTSAAFTFVDSHKVTAVVPNAATTGRITLTTPSGPATSASNFSVMGTGPTISSFNPSQGNVGTLVTINGTNFTGVSSVKFNGTAATFTIVSSSRVTAVVPNGATTGKITLTTPAGTATSAATFTVSGPKITGFNPSQGNVGALVTIDGTNFTGVSSVKFNGTSAAFTFVSGVKVTAVVPNGGTTGTITLTTPAGTATSAGAFTVLATHSRTISLSLGRSPLLAAGHVSVTDGYSACARYVPVVFKRYHRGQWRWITTTSTSQNGGFRVPIPDRSGRYRAKAIKIKLANGTTCNGDLSNIVRHHRRS